MAGENLWMIALLVVAALVGSALLVLAISSGSRQRKALEMMAARNGWRYAYERASAGRGSTLTLSDPAARWTVSIYSNSSSDTGGSTTRWTRFDRPDLALPQGAVILGPAIPAQAAQFASMVMENFASRFLGKLILGIDEAGGDVARLAHVSEVDATSGTLFATPEARHALDPLIRHGALTAAREGLAEMKQPIVSRTTGGFRIRVRRALYNPKDVAALVTLGEVLAASLENADSRTA